MHTIHRFVSTTLAALALLAALAVSGPAMAIDSHGQFYVQGPAAAVSSSYGNSATVLIYSFDSRTWPGASGMNYTVIDARYHVSVHNSAPGSSPASCAAQLFVDGVAIGVVANVGWLHPDGSYEYSVLSGEYHPTFYYGSPPPWGIGYHFVELRITGGGAGCTAEANSASLTLQLGYVRL